MRGRCHAVKQSSPHGISPGLPQAEVGISVTACGLVVDNKYDTAACRASQMGLKVKPPSATVAATAASLSLHRPNTKPLFHAPQLYSAFACNFGTECSRPVESTKPIQPVSCGCRRALRTVLLPDAFMPLTTAGSRQCSRRSLGLSGRQLAAVGDSPCRHAQAALSELPSKVWLLCFCTL